MKKQIKALLLGLFAAGATLGAVSLHSAADDTNESVVSEADEETDQALAQAISGVEMTAGEHSDFSYANVADVAEAVMPSVVSITNMSVQEVRNYFSRRQYQYESTSAGSGIIVGSNETELLICTNNHVVEGATTLTVTFVDDASCEAQIKGTDPDNDLAVVAVQLEEISKDTMDQIRIAKIGSSDQMRVGEQVVAIGNALGYGQSVTTGIVSAKNRTIQVGEDNGGYGRYGNSSENATGVYEDLIQTDAAINPGNSGGALLNMNGEVIGINSAKAGTNGVEGMGYAIPIDKAMPILNDLMSRTTRTRLEEGAYGYLGINGQSVSTEATLFYGIPEGLYLTYVPESGPAGQAGLAEGDIITAFEGTPVYSMDDLVNQLTYYAPGETVTLKVSVPVSQSGYGYEEKTMEVTLGDRSELQ